MPADFRLTSETDSGYRDDDGVTNVTAPVLRADVESGTQVELLLAEELLMATEGAGETLFELGPLADGIYGFLATAEDAAGNISLASSMTVVVDTIVPALEFTGPSSGATVTRLSQLQGTLDSSGMPTRRHNLPVG